MSASHLFETYLSASGMWLNEDLSEGQVGLPTPLLFD
jgi:hypothetical protein